MLTALEQKRIRDLITETVTVLCQSSLNFRSKLTVEGLLGITIDDKDVFLINIHKVMSSSKEESVSCSTMLDNDDNANGVTCTQSFQQNCDLEPRSKSTDALQNTCMLPCHQQVEENTHSDKNQTVLSEKPLPAVNEPLIGTRLSLLPGTDDNEPMSSSSREICQLTHHTGSYIKEESTSDDDGTDSQLDYVGQNLLMGYNLTWSREQKVSHRSGGSTGNCTAEDSALLRYTVVPGGSSRGGLALTCTDGHRYLIKMSKPDVTYWRCVVRNRFCVCQAVVIQRGGMFTRGIRDHCHSPLDAATAPDD